MNWEEAISYIESPLFDAELNMVSGTSAFLRTARKQPAVQQALLAMRESGEHREEVLDRVYHMAMEETDPRYENPNDTPLAVLLWLTCYTEPDLARLGARFVEHAPRCWYASRLARHINSPPATNSIGCLVRAGTESRISFHSSSTMNEVSAFLPTAKISASNTLGDGGYRTAVSGAEHLVSQWGNDYARTVSKQPGRRSRLIYVDEGTSLGVENWFQSPPTQYAAGAQS